MILDRLVLDNFKRFRHEEIRFRDGITGILGNNGTGKSSLVQAIFFALYGVQATGISADYIVSSFAGPKEKCEVRLDFRIGGDEYAVVRSFRKGKTTTHDASFYHNKKMMATGVSQVEEAVRRTLGMGPVDFRNTIYAAQKDLLTLLENTPGKRKEWFQRALGIDYLNNESQKILKDEIDTKTGELQRKEGELAALEGRQSVEELAALKASVTRFAAAIAEHEKKKALLVKQRQELDGQAKVFGEKKTAIARLLQQQQALRQELASETAQAKKLETALALVADEEAEYHRIEKTAGSYAEVRSCLNELQKQKAEHARLTGELGFIRREIAELGARREKQISLLEAIEKEAKERARIAAEVRAGIGATSEIADERLDGVISYRLNEIMKRIGTLNAQQSRYQEEREKIEADLLTLQTAGPDGTCPLCRQKLGEHLGSLETGFRSKLEELENRAIADLEKQERLEKERAAIEAMVPSLEILRTISGRMKIRIGYETELGELRQKFDKKMQEEHALAETIAQLGYDDAACRKKEREAAEVQKVQLRFIELGKKIGEARTTKLQLADLTIRIRERNGALAALEKEIADAAFDPAQAAKIEKALQETDTGLRSEEVCIAGAAKDLRFAQEKIADFERAEEQIEILKKQAQELREESGLLRLTRTFIAEYVVYLMQVVRSRLEGEVSRIISEITGGRYEQVLLDEDFNLLVRDIDNDYAIDRFSGGEQDDIAVALRIALSRYLAELHQVHESTFLIFDEIFGSQDEERRNNLLVALRTQESRFPQILLISHIAEIQGEFANTLIVEMGADNASRIREAG
ncbi:SMC family ATPase [uncultured Methanoregula sp.]|uniref:SMC family ATPase n=1 Tax=uncultured Methanoregula sp. TaxID=1005933 RepID=UPI002AAACA95|nr:SMC family ATPase [uncultured Methanoregula sp.]